MQLDLDAQFEHQGTLVNGTYYAEVIATNNNGMQVIVEARGKSGPYPIGSMSVENALLLRPMPELTLSTELPEDRAVALGDFAAQEELLAALDTAQRGPEVYAEDMDRH